MALATPDMSARSTLASALAGALEGRHLLEHPFYRRWEAGDLDVQELAEYAVHYRAFEARLPELLAELVGELERSGADEVAGLVDRNLQDELTSPEPHLALFDRFAAALPAPAAVAPGASAQGLVGTYDELAASGPVALLAGLAAYETQASAIARTKADGLVGRYDVDRDGAAFWEVHAAMDAEHGEWALEALGALAADPDAVARAARLAADAWWSFLDEREAEAA